MEIFIFSFVFLLVGLLLGFCAGQVYVFSTRQKQLNNINSELAGIATRTETISERFKTFEEHEQHQNEQR